MTRVSIILTLSLLSALALLSCKRAPTPDSPLSPGGRVHGVRAKALVDEGALLLDVRSPQEFAGGHLKGAINIPVQSLSQRLSELPRGKKVIVYCRSGRRSAKATELIHSSREIEVYDLGPMSAFPK